MACKTGIRPKAPDSYCVYGPTRSPSAGRRTKGDNVVFSGFVQEWLNCCRDDGVGDSGDNYQPEILAQYSPREVKRLIVWEPFSVEAFGKSRVGSEIN